MKILRKIFSLTYAIYLIMFIDSRFTNPIFKYYKYYTWIFILLWSVLLITINSDTKIVISKKNKAINLMFSIILYFLIFGIISLLSAMASYSELELQNWIQFILTLVLCTYWVGKLKLEYIFIYISYMVSSIIIAIAFFVNGAPLDVLTRIDKVFSSTDRYRLTFGYYHVNGLGNLCAFAIILSVMLIYIILQVKKRNRIKKMVNIALIFILDVITLIVLLSTASRSSIMILGIFIIVMIYYFVIYMKVHSPKVRFLLSLVLVALAAAVIIFGLWQQIVLLFIDSNRMRNFMINLPLLKENGKLLMGLGIVDPGLFGTKMTIYGRSYYVDNYYLYIIVETGILGSLFLVTILIRLGTLLHRNIKKIHSFLSIVIYACFIAQIFAGMGETSVFYYIFPASLVYWCIYLLEISKTFDERIKGD